MSVLLVTIQEVGPVVLVAEEEGPRHTSGLSNVECLTDGAGFEERRDDIGARRSNNVLTVVL